MTDPITIWRMPTWLSRLLNWRWLGFLGIVAASSDPLAAPDLVAHEEAHIEREDVMGGGIRRALGWGPARVWGCIRWVTRYLFSRRFRLDEEVAAFVAEMADVEPFFWASSAEIFSKDLAGPGYLWAARSEQEALEVIWKALGPIPLGHS